MRRATFPCPLCRDGGRVVTLESRGVCAGALKVDHGERRLRLELGLESA